MSESKVNLIDEESIITLYDEDQQELNFYEIATVEYGDEIYGIFQPAEKIEGLEDDEVVIMLIEKSDNDEELNLTAVTDENILDAVFEEYCKASMEDDGCGCGCDECEDEDCEHHSCGDCDCDECK